MKYVSIVLLVILATACGKSKDIATHKNENVQENTQRSMRFFSAFCPIGDWQLEIELDKSIYYRNIKSGFVEVKNELPAQLLSTDSEVLYTASTVTENMQKLTVVVYAEKCKENEMMHKIAVTLSGDNPMENKVHTGCGMFHNGTGLAGLWLIDEINGVKASKHFNNLPLTRMEFFQKGNAISGAIGCRKFAGTLDYSTQKFSTSIRQAPNFDCRESPEEYHVINLFGEKVFHFEVKKSMLILSNEETMLIFKRID
jgi:heat shock protein HslJ/DNA-directed RNA polymerase subunit M/transcription elongation factor TFIIS